jgi:carboxypeptidase T
MNEITSKGFGFNLNIERIIPISVKVFSLRLFSCLVIFVIELASAAAPIPAIKDLVNVQIPDRAELNRLRQLASDLDEHYANLLQGFVTIYASDAEQAMLKASGFNFQVVIENLSDYYAQRAIRERQPRQAVTNSMGGFRTLVEIERTLEQLTKTFPNSVSNKFSIGKSYEGRDIWAIRLSAHPNVYEPTEPTVWFDALHHAREAMSGESLLLFADWLVNHYGTEPTVTRLTLAIFY